MLRLANAAIFYLSFGVRVEEHRRAKERDKGLAAPIRLSIVPDNEKQ